MTFFFLVIPGKVIVASQGKFQLVVFDSKGYAGKPLRLAKHFVELSLGHIPKGFV